MAKHTKLLCMALVATMATSCGYAKKADVDQLRFEMSEVRNTSQAAKSAAEESKRIAEQSLEASKRTEETVNRSFKRSMRK